MIELLPRQDCFVNEYIKTLNITQSAIKAGYASNSAHVTKSRLIRNEKGDEYIKSQQDKMMSDSILTAKELLHLLTSAVVGAMRLKQKKLW